MLTLNLSENIKLLYSGEEHLLYSKNNRFLNGKISFTKVIGLVNRAEYKRYQAAPVLRVSTKAFGIGRQVPIVAKFDF